MQILYDNTGESYSYMYMMFVLDSRNYCNASYYFEWKTVSSLQLIVLLIGS